MEGKGKEVKKKLSQDKVSRSRNPTEVFVYLLLDCAIVHFFSSLVWNDLPNSLLEDQVHQQYK